MSGDTKALSSEHWIGLTSVGENRALEGLLQVADIFHTVTLLAETMLQHTLAELALLLAPGINHDHVTLRQCVTINKTCQRCQLGVLVKNITADY